MRDFMILITSLKFFRKIPMGTCEETSLKLNKLVQFFGKKSKVNDDFWTQVIYPAIGR